MGRAYGGGYLELWFATSFQKPFYIALLDRMQNKVVKWNRKRSSSFFCTEVHDIYLQIWRNERPSPQLLIGVVLEGQRSVAFDI